MTGDVVNAFHTRDFKGQTVAFCDGDCACGWDGLKDEGADGQTRCGHRGFHAQDAARRLNPGPGTQAPDHAGGDDAMPAGVDADEERAALPDARRHLHRGRHQGQPAR
jgi:hypothetical protein